MELTEKQQKKYEQLIEGKNLTESQKYVILVGVGLGLNAKVYAKPEYTINQMLEIRAGLENNVRVSSYAKPYFTWDQMLQIRLVL